jgi:hypothetical protein
MVMLVHVNGLLRAALVLLLLLLTLPLLTLMLLLLLCAQLRERMLCVASCEQWVRSSRSDSGHWRRSSGDAAAAAGCSRL